MRFASDFCSDLTFCLHLGAPPFFGDRQICISLSSCFPLLQPSLKNTYFPDGADCFEIPVTSVGGWSVSEGILDWLNYYLLLLVSCCLSWRRGQLSFVDVVPPEDASDSRTIPFYSCGLLLFPSPCVCCPETFREIRRRNMYLCNCEVILIILFQLNLLF